MKILHTSDWHLGQEFYTFDRTEEHTSFFHQLQEIVAEEKPDVMVVSGDIYHNATPSNSVMRLFTDELDQVRKACPGMQMIVTAGNHDSCTRLEVNQSIWSHLNVTIIGRIYRKDGDMDWNRHLLPVRDASGNCCGYVVALPHVFPNAFPLLDDETPRERRQEAFFEALAAQVSKLDHSLPVVMMAHMAITGSETKGHDQSRGGMDFLDLNALKVPYDYLALGHIHCPQWINDEHARYCGSPIPVNFEETYPHSVTLVEIKKHGEVPVSKVIPIHNPWPLLTLPKDALPFDEALQELAKLEDTRKAYIRLHVQLKDVPPQNAMERAAQALKGKQARFCCFLWEKAEAGVRKVQTFQDVDEMKAQSPLEIARLYYQNQFGKEMDEDLQQMLTQTIQEMQDYQSEGKEKES